MALISRPTEGFYERPRVRNTFKNSSLDQILQPTELLSRTASCQDVKIDKAAKPCEERDSAQDPFRMRNGRASPARPKLKVKYPRKRPPSSCTPL